MAGCYWYFTTIHCDAVIWYYCGAASLVLWATVVVGILFFGWFGLRPRQQKYEDLRTPTTTTVTFEEQTTKDKDKDKKKKKMKKQ